MKNELSGKYLEDYNEIEKYLRKHIKGGEKLEETLSDLIEMYSDIEAEGTEISSVHEGSALDYAKELAAELPKKEHLFSFKGIIVFSAIIFVILFLIFIKNGPLARNHGIDSVAQNTDKYNLVDSESTDIIFRLYNLDGKIHYGITNSIVSDFLYITEADFSDLEKIYIRGKATSFFNGDGNGQIYIPAIYTHMYWHNPESVIDLITDFDEEEIRILSDINTNTNIQLISEGYATSEDYLYFARPINYKINSDGSVDFEFVFEKTVSKLNQKNLQEHITEGETVYLILSCASVEWNSTNPFY